MHLSKYNTKESHPTSLQRQKTKMVISLDLAILAKLPSFCNYHVPPPHFPLTFYPWFALHSQEPTAKPTCIVIHSLYNGGLGNNIQRSGRTLEWLQISNHFSSHVQPGGVRRQSLFQFHLPRSPSQSQTFLLYSLTHQSLI